MRKASYHQILLTSSVSLFIFLLTAVFTSFEESSVLSYFFLWLFNGLMTFGLIVLATYTFFKSGVSAEFQKFLARLFVHIGVSMLVLVIITVLFANAIE
jgi:hypothetical protein